MDELIFTMRTAAPLIALIGLPLAAGVLGWWALGFRRGLALCLGLYAVSLVIVIQLGQIY